MTTPAEMHVPHDPDYVRTMARLCSWLVVVAKENHQQYNARSRGPLVVTIPVGLVVGQHATRETSEKHAAKCKRVGGTVCAVVHIDEWDGTPIDPNRTP